MHQNPGKMTLQGVFIRTEMPRTLTLAQGTNTYLLGRHAPYILFDTGEGKEEYIPFIETALWKESIDDPPVSPMVSDVIVSHDHHDHWGGLPQLLKLLRILWERKHTDYPFVPPRIHKSPGSLSEGLNEILKKLDRNDYLPAAHGEILHDLVDDQILKGSDVELLVLHTPGHTPDSICLLLKEENSLLTADTVLGAGTAVFSNLTQYMKSLRRLNGIRSEYNTILPGHGPVVEDGPAKIQEYIHHRQEREDQILEVLKSKQTESWKVTDIVAVIYAAYPKNLWDWAGRVLTLHLEKLEHDGKVERTNGDTWKLV